jgi:hypothetical protein
MAFLPTSASEAEGVIIETYGDLNILVPEGLRQHSAELFKNQKRAIDLGAVLKTDVGKEIIDFENLGWVFEEQRHCCYHMNIPPVRRENLRAEYKTYVFLSLTERKGFVVATVFAAPVGDCFQFPIARLRNYLKIEWSCFKKYFEELSTNINSANKHTESLIPILRTHCYNQA